LGAGACVYPADESAELAVQLDSVPELFLKDTVQLSAQVVTAAGQPVTGAAISFLSSDAAVLSIDSAGRALAVGAGTATVSAVAQAFEEAQAAARVVRVRGLIEVDSVQPLTVRFGDSLHVFGVGLNPDSLFTMNLSGVELQAARYVPASATRPNGLGRLSLWVMPPSAKFSLLTLVSIGGGLAFPDTIGVAQHDRYEFNDTIPTSLGDIPVAFWNPALAFEPQARSEDRQPADWYTFTNTAASDRTVIVLSDFVGAQTFSVFMTDSLAWDGAASQWLTGPQSWTIGPQTYLCAGKSVTRNGEPVVFNERVFPITIMSLAALPAGTYHVLVPYLEPAQPTAYQVLIAKSYQSAVPRDAAEENDYCDVAAPLSATAGATLSIDNPHDIDWYRFTSTSPAALFTATVTPGGAASANLEDPDLDLYLIRDFRPDSLILMRASTSSGNSETLSQLVPPGDYFLVVVDFAGSPAQYTMTSSFAAPPSPAVMQAGAPATTVQKQPVRRGGDRVGAALRAQGARRP
jgi:hypothetical protein